MIGQLCGSYDQYLAGGCLSCEEPGERCAVMGYHLKKHRYPMNFSTKNMLNSIVAELDPMARQHFSGAVAEGF
jgi:Anaphase-promoting complex subunit 11 RING-H2 finger/Lipase